MQSEGDAAGPARDAVDVATFHAAKGLEWATVHLAGAEDGFVPIAHARTAAAKAEEVRLLYVAMTRAERELRITYAEQRTFNGRVVDRRPSPLLDPLHRRGRAAPAPARHLPPSDDADDRPSWQDELARQRARRSRRAAPAVSPELEALRAWRDIAARAARIEPEAVLPDHVLARVAAARPERRRGARRDPRRRADPRPALRGGDPRRARGRRRGVRFTIEQQFAADVDAVAAGLRRPRRCTPPWSGCRSCPSPRCVAHEVDGDVVRPPGALPLRR